MLHVLLVYPLHYLQPTPGQQDRPRAACLAGLPNDNAGVYKDPVQPEKPEKAAKGKKKGGKKKAGGGKKKGGKKKKK